MGCNAKSSWKTARRARRGGFTLIELLVVMAIILILMSLIVGVSIGVMKEQSRARARAEIQGFHDALQAFRVETGALPPALKEVRQRLPVKILTQLNKRSGTELLDPWRRPYEYVFNPNEPETYTLYSKGPKEDIKEDDIYSSK